MSAWTVLIASALAALTVVGIMAQWDSLAWMTTGILAIVVAVGSLMTEIRPPRR